MNKCEYSVVCIISQKLPIYGISFVLVTYHDHTSSDTQSHTLTPLAPSHPLTPSIMITHHPTPSLTPSHLTPSHPLTPSITINAGMVMFPGYEQWLAFVAREPIVRCVKSASPMTLLMQRPGFSCTHPSLCTHHGRGAGRFSSEVSRPLHPATLDLLHQICITVLQLKGREPEWSNPHNY